MKKFFFNLSDPENRNYCSDRVLETRQTFLVPVQLFSFPVKFVFWRHPSWWTVLSYWKNMIEEIINLMTHIENKISTIKIKIGDPRGDWRSLPILQPKYSLLRHRRYQSLAQTETTMFSRYEFTDGFDRRKTFFKWDLKWWDIVFHYYNQLDSYLSA